MSDYFKKLRPKSFIYYCKVNIYHNFCLHILYSNLFLKAYNFSFLRNCTILVILVTLKEITPDLLVVSTVHTVFNFFTISMNSNPTLAKDDWEKNSSKIPDDSNYFLNGTVSREKYVNWGSGRATTYCISFSQLPFATCILIGSHE